MPGKSFDRVADHYDRTRGGERRGGAAAAAIAPWIVGRRVVELGIGTGVVGLGLAGRGHRVCGVDLSEPMLQRAVDRLGPCVARADVDALPFASDSVDTAIFVWVLQLVDEPKRSMAEAARIVRPGGRVIVVSADGDDHSVDEIAAAMAPLLAIRQPNRSREAVRHSAPPDLTLIEEGFTPWNDFEGSATQQVELIEQRSYSSLFDLDDDAWREHVEPVLTALRAMPDPDRMRPRRNRHPLLVWEVTGP